MSAGATPPTLLVAFEGLDAPQAVLSAVRRGQIAGVALYRTLNVEAPERLRALSGAIQAAALEGGHPPAIVAIDQEGGQLHGVGPPATQFAGNMALGATRSADLARRVGMAIGWELRALGVTVDWAPVCDLATRSDNPAVGTRAFSDDPSLAAALGAAMVEGLQSTGVAATLKHFPGSGDTTADPHHGLVTVESDPATIERRELMPFRAGIAAGARLVMVSHATYPGLEPDRSGARSAMRSPEILRRLLRDRLGFDGVVVSDALDMDSIDQRNVPHAAGEAMDAGVDLLLAGPAQAARLDQLEQIRRTAWSHPDAQLAGRRIDHLRRRLDTDQPSLEILGCVEHQALAVELARAAITLVRDEGGVIPLRLSERARLLVVTPRPADLTPADTSSTVEVRLGAALERRHPGCQLVEVPIEPDAQQIAYACGQACGVDAVIVGTIDAFANPGQLELVRALVRVGPPVILVAMRSPADAAALPEARAVLCCYSIHDAATDAAAAVLLGEAGAPGRLPIELPPGMVQQ
jgi:beta-N-acetylhexosaminidase